MMNATKHLALELGLAVVVLIAAAGAAWADPPTYQIYDLGVLDPGDFGSQGFGVSDNGIAAGRTLGVSNQGFSWTEGGGTVALPNLPSRPYGSGNGVNEASVAVGTGSTTAFGSDPLPLIWENGAVSQLPLPAGQTLGRATDINDLDVAVGSIGSGTTQYGVIYAGGVAEILTTTTDQGCYSRDTFAINDGNRVVGFGIDPNNPSRNVGFVYDRDTDTAFEVGAIPGANGAIAFGVSNAGHVVGSSMLNQGSGRPFIWTDAGGIVEVPLPAGTSQGSLRDVNSAGWAVGTASSAYAIPFLYDGVSSYALGDLLPPDSGWDLSTNTSSSAEGISEDGVIVGTGVHDGEVRAYAMVPENPGGIDRSPRAATALFLAPPSPNPTRGSTNLAFRLGREEQAWIEVFDVRGRPVRHLGGEVFAAGEHTRAWDGRTDQGGLAPAGTYFVRVRTSGADRTRTVTVAR